MAINLIAPFSLKTSEPLDVRSVVEDIAALNERTNFYKGELVYVKSENKYFSNSGDEVTPNWVELETSGTGVTESRVQEMLLKNLALSPGSGILVIDENEDYQLLNGIDGVGYAPDPGFKGAIFYFDNLGEPILTDYSDENRFSLGEGAALYINDSGNPVYLNIKRKSSSATDLGYTASTRVLTSSTGTNVTLPLATTTDAGLLSSSDKVVLDDLYFNVFNYIKRLEVTELSSPLTIYTNTIGKADYYVIIDYMLYREGSDASRSGTFTCSFRANGTYTTTDTSNNPAVTLQDVDFNVIYTDNAIIQLTAVDTNNLAARLVIRTI